MIQYFKRWTKRTVERSFGTLEYKWKKITREEVESYLDAGELMILDEKGKVSNFYAEYKSHNRNIKQS